MTKVKSREKKLLEIDSFQASVRAMDATQGFAKQLGIPVPKTFVVAGASKVRRRARKDLTQKLFLLLKFVARLDE